MPEVIRIGSAAMMAEVSAFGAEMQSLKTGDGRSFLWSGDAAFWNGRSPILFPMVGKAPDNKLGIEGQSYDMNQHGFARRSEFSLVYLTPTTSRHRLESDSRTIAVYPFDFALTVQHEVKGRTLTVSAEVENRDHRPMPFGFGFHPAFAWPLPGAEGRRHGVSLANGGEPYLKRLKGGLIAPERLRSPFSTGSLALDHAMFVDDAMIFPEGAGDSLNYGAEGGPTLRLRFENLPNLALWTKPDAPFICIEPWHGMAAEADASNEITARPYTVTLPPGQSSHFAFSVTIDG